MSPIQFGNEIIYARELTYAEYDEFSRTAPLTDDPIAWRDKQIDMMVRFAVREDGSRRFQDRSELNGIPAKTVLKTVYAFTNAFSSLNIVSDDDFEELRKN
jgi:hypothetical protein